MNWRRHSISLRSFLLFFSVLICKKSTAAAIYVVLFTQWVNSSEEGNRCGQNITMPLPKLNVFQGGKMTDPEIIGKKMNSFGL